MSEWLPDFESLRLLTLLGGLGSLGQAAERMGISQPAASKRLRALERQLRLPLARRGARGTVLTTEGKALCQWSERVLAEVDELLAGAAALRDGRGGELRLAASMTFAEHYLPVWIAALREKSPETRCSLRITNSEQVCRLVEQEAVQLGFVETPIVPKTLGSRIVARDRLVVAVAVDHPWARRRRPLRLDELAGTALVVRERGSGTRETLEQLFVRARLHAVEPVMVLETNAAVRSAVSAGVGAAVLSATTIQDELLLGRLVEVPVTDVDLTRSLRAVWRRDARPALAGVELLRIAGRLTDRGVRAAQSSSGGAKRASAATEGTT